MSQKIVVRYAEPALKKHSVRYKCASDIVKTSDIYVPYTVIERMTEHETRVPSQIFVTYALELETKV